MLGSVINWFVLHFSRLHTIFNVFLSLSSAEVYVVLRLLPLQFFFFF